PLGKKAQDVFGIATPQGTYIPRFLGFGPKSAPAASSRIMDRLLDGLHESCSGRIDDVIVATETFDEHLEILKLLFARMKQMRISINIEKTKLLQDQVIYMGYQVDGGGLALKDLTVKKLHDAKLPTTYQELKSFNGLAEWCRSFAGPHFHEDMAILSEALTRKRKFYLLEEEQQAFKRICASDLVKLVHPNWGEKFSLHTDTSEHSISSILSQKHGVIAYGGRKLTDAERKRAIPEKELLAVVQAITITHRD